MLNRTNQFSTSGHRWTMRDCVTHFRGGGVFHVFEVQDRFTRYGLVGVIAVAANMIAQFVMSCRVAGLDVKTASLAKFAIGPAGKVLRWRAPRLSTPTQNPLPRPVQDLRIRTRGACLRASFGPAGAWSISPGFDRLQSALMFI